MRILLTGGTGFVGRHLIAGLSGRYEIVAPTHAELDISDSVAMDSYFHRNSFDGVIHAAVKGGPGVFESTLRGYWNVAKQNARVQRILYFGSGAEFGKHRDLVKVPETVVGDVTPQDAYGLAKLLCNQLARQTRNIVNLRLFGIFGEHEGYAAKFISNAVAKALTGLPIAIRQDVIFDYLWINDLVRMIPFFLESDRGVADVNVTPTESISLRDIADLVVAEVGSDTPITVESPGMNWQYTGDNQRLLTVLGGFDFTSVANGISHLVRHYRRHQADLDRDALVRDDYRRRCRTRAIAAT